MSKRNIIMVMILCAACILAAACESETEREREAGRRAEAKNVFAPDGSIHLTPEQVKTNRLQTATVRGEQLAPTVTAIGRVKARAGGESEVFSPFAGCLIADPARFPRVGSFVRRGELLAQVEQLVSASEQTQFSATAAQLEAEIRQGQQEVDLRQIELDRSRPLYEGGAIALKQLQAAEFNVKQAQARLDGARRSKAQYDAILSRQNTGPRRAPIRAPITGTVLAADVTPGQQIDPSKSLMKIVDLSSVWVEVPVHETNLPAVRRAQRAEITSPAVPGKTYYGSLVVIAGTVDGANRTIPVIFAVANPDGGLKIEMTAEARIPKSPTATVLLVPASAVLYEEGQSFVYVEVKPNVYQHRVIATRERKGDSIVVASGLKAGEKVVSVGAQSLRSETLKGQIPAESEGEKR